MYLRKQKKPNGRIYLSVVQSYRTTEGKPRSKTLWSLGYVDELAREHPDPIAHFQRVIDELNSSNSEQKDGETPVVVTFSPNARIPLNEPSPIEAGAAIVLSVLHRAMGLTQAVRGITSSPAKTGRNKCEAHPLRKSDLERITELMVWNRIAHPRLFTDIWAKRAGVPGMESLTCDAFFEGVRMLGKNSERLRELVNDAMRKNSPCAQDSWAYCFVFNHYIEGTRFSQPDYEASWQNRTNPIVQTAVLTDRCGIPFDYGVFDTNLATPLSSFPAIQELSGRHPGMRLIVVADKAIGSSNYELDLLANLGHGFVLLQSMRRGKRTSREWVLDATGYAPLDAYGSRFKQRMDIRTIEREDAHRQYGSIAVKEVALWLRDAYESTRFNRFREIRRTENAFSNGAPSGGLVRPMRALYGDGDAKFGATGDHIWHVYWEKIAADEAMDGYLNIITSELDLDALEVIGLYRSLESVRSFYAPMPGEWSAAPDTLSRQDFLQAHFLVCYLGACVVQLLHECAGKDFPEESLRIVLANLTGIEVSPGSYFFSFRSRLSDRLAEAAHIDLSRPLMSASELSHLMQAVRRP